MIYFTRGLTKVLLVVWIFTNLKFSHAAPPGPKQPKGQSTKNVAMMPQRSATPLISSHGGFIEISRTGSQHRQQVVSRSTPPLTKMPQQAVAGKATVSPRPTASQPTKPALPTKPIPPPQQPFSSAVNIPTQSSKSGTSKTATDSANVTPFSPKPTPLPPYSALASDQLTNTATNNPTIIKSVAAPSVPASSKTDNALSLGILSQCTVEQREISLVPSNAQLYCKVKISEVHVEQKENQFIELERICNKKILQEQYLGLNGHVIIVVKMNAEPTVLLVANLDGETLTKAGPHNVEKYFYVIGSPMISQVGLAFGQKQKWQKVVKLQYTGYPTVTGVLPLENDVPIAVFLLYIPARVKSNVMSVLELPKISGSKSETTFYSYTISEEVKLALRGKIVDSFFYGLSYTEQSEIFIQNLLQNEDFTMSNMISSISVSPTTVGKPMSYSKCSMSFENIGVIEITIPTPLETNACPTENTYTTPYKISGWTLGTSGKKMILNLLHQLKENADANLFLGSPAAVASRLLGVNRHTIYRIQRSGETCFASKKREFKKWKQCEIDSFDRDVIRTIISDSFKKGKAPLFKEIYNSYLEYKRNGCISYTTSSAMTNGNQFLPLYTETNRSSSYDADDRTTHNVPAEPYTGSSGTFARVLYDMGFKYGLIDKRVCLMQRQDLFTWRRMFTQAIMDNEKSPNPKKVTYLDETWVDPHTKWSKGWTLRNPVNSMECLKYSFRDIKISSGPRLVVIAAGDNDGLIKESIKVRKIDTKDVAGDYHRNVNAVEFIEWFKNLLDVFDKRNEKHIIVIDNAPYHSTQSAPKQSDKKAVMMAWLNEKRKNANLNIPDVSKMKKDELWNEVSKIKNNPNFAEEVYELDRLAVERGHKILRLPPYHCVFNPIEGTWHDVKTLVAKLNLNQNVNDVLKLVENSLQNYSPDQWKRHVGHCRKLMQKHWEEDGHKEISVDPLIIPLFDDSEETDYEEEDDMSEDEDDEGCIDVETEFDPLEIEEDLRLGRIEVEKFHSGQAANTAALPLFKFPGRTRKRKFIDID